MWLKDSIVKNDLKMNAKIQPFLLSNLPCMSTALERNQDKDF